MYDVSLGGAAITKLGFIMADLTKTRVMTILKEMFYKMLGEANNE